MEASLTETLELLETEDAVQNASALRTKRQAEERRSKEAKAARDKMERDKNKKKGNGQEEDGGYSHALKCLSRHLY